MKPIFKQIGGLLVLLGGLMLLPFDRLSPASTTDTQATGKEVIENYESKINVRKDGRLIVTESITVRNTKGGQIKRGIYRYFPNPNFKIFSVQRDGNRATYRTQVNNGRKHIEIWKKDVYLDPGIYTYQIQYLTDQQIEDKGEQAQLYWNVTGQEWAFPIQKVEAEVILPEGIPSDDIALNAFTGYQGERGKSFQTKFKGNNAKFTTTGILKKRQGLSIIVNFPGGFVESTESIDGFTSSEQKSSDTAFSSNFPIFRLFWSFVIFAVLIFGTFAVVILGIFSGDQGRGSEGTSRGSGSGIAGSGAGGGTGGGDGGGDGGGGGGSG